MSPTTADGTQITLTCRHIDEWPESEKTLTPAGRWPGGIPASISTPPVERAVPICRRLAALWLDAEAVHDEATRYTVLLVMSELITNAIRHSRSARITNRLWKSGDLLFVEVRDQGGTASVPRVHCSDSSQEHGRGLALVSEAARDWGRKLSADGGRTVWAAIPLGSDDAPHRTARPDRPPPADDRAPTAD
jgi:anti-sigma regulatory factor (Ser/Thr protein kinase)